MKEFEKFSDIEIINRILGGASKLFEILIRRNNSLLHKTGRSYGYNHEDTQDLMQETYLSAYINLSKFENRSSFKTWIIKIMLNNCYHKQQKYSFKNEKTYATEINENSTPMYSNNKNTDTDKVVLNRELNHIIENSLAQIPIEYRMVFSLREISGMNVLETAEVLNINESNVKVRLNRAKSMLRKEIEKTYDAEEIFEFNLVYCDAMVDRVMNKLKTVK